MKGCLEFRVDQAECNLIAIHSCIHVQFWDGRRAAAEVAHVFT